MTKALEWAAAAVLLLPGLPAAAEGMLAPTFEDTPSVSGDARENWYSQARVRVYPLGRPDLELEGFQVFVDGKAMGLSPLSLGALFVEKDAYTLTAVKQGWMESSVASLAIPRGGEIRVAALKENPVAYYTRPSLALSLALIAGSLVAYAQPGGGEAGLGVLAGGIALACVTQAFARFFHVPSLRRRLARANLPSNTLHP